MAKPFDSTLKELFETNPADWAYFVGHPATVAQVIDADVSTVTAGSDKVIHVLDDPQWLLHVELQSGPDQSLPRRCHLYSTLLDNRHDLPVRSVVILLRRQANLLNLTGIHERAFADEEPHLRFRYHVVRIWELDVNEVLQSGLSLLPLAPLCDNAVDQIETVLSTLSDRFKEVEPPSRQSDLWLATSILMGLRYEQAIIQQLFQRMTTMEDSVTYQMIIEKGIEKGIEQGIEKGIEQGKQKEARQLILLLGTKKFGAPDPEVQQSLEQIDDLEALHELILRTQQDVSSWGELLTPSDPES